MIWTGAQALSLLEQCYNTTFRYSVMVSPITAELLGCQALFSAELGFELSSHVTAQLSGNTASSSFPNQWEMLGFNHCFLLLPPKLPPQFYYQFNCSLFK